jgi:hypothetical protein
MVHYGQAESVVRQRQAVLDIAYQLHPERFVSAPKPPALPNKVWINEPVATPEPLPLGRRQMKQQRRQYLQIRRPRLPRQSEGTRSAEHDSSARGTREALALLSEAQRHRDSLRGVQAGAALHVRPPIPSATHAGRLLTQFTYSQWDFLKGSNRCPIKTYEHKSPPGRVWPVALTPMEKAADG